MYDICIEETQKVGMRQYEISNFAMPGQESRHNLTYWHYGDYIGIGPGAASRYLVPGTGRVASKRVRLSSVFFGSSPNFFLLLSAAPTIHLLYSHVMSVFNSDTCFLFCPQAPGEFLFRISTLLRFF
jgi:hypothetical protein